jgi:hypothetical protein
MSGWRQCRTSVCAYWANSTSRGAIRTGWSAGNCTELEVGPGEVSALPQGHDAWVVGDDPVVLIDWWGASNYGKA